MESNNKILLVEDREEFSNPAIEELKLCGYDVTLATDYVGAMGELNDKSKGYSGVLTDCFFPESTGSGNIELGRSLAKTMFDVSPDVVKLTKTLDTFSKLVDVTALNVKKHIEYFMVTHMNTTKDVLDSGIYKQFERMFDEHGFEESSKVTKHLLDLMYCEDNTRFVSVNHYSDLLAAGIEESEFNQPLGVLVAMKSKELSLPVILATSTHHHGDLTQSVFEYCGTKGIKLVDSGFGDKSTPKFWKGAVGELEKKISELEWI